MTQVPMIHDPRPESRIELGVDTRLVLQKLLRRKWLVVTSTLVLFALFVAAILAIPPWYTAEAEIVIDQRPQGTDFAAVLTRLPTDSQAVLTEAEALRSRSIVEKTIAQLDLLSNPEFNPAIIPDDRSLRSRWRQIRRYVSSVIASFVGPAGKETENAAQNTAVDIFLNHLKVVPVGRSQDLHVTFTSKSPELASRALNSLILQYLSAQVEHRLSVPKALVNFMQGELELLQEKVRTTDEALEQYRNKANLQQGITQGRETLLLTQELSDANTQLSTIRTKRQEAESRLNEIRANPNSFPDVLGNADIQRLRALLSAQRQSQLVWKAGSNPRIDGMIADTEQQIKADIEKIIISISGDVAIQTEREHKAAAMVAGLKQQIENSGGSRVELARLEQAAQVSRSILTSFLTQYTQLASQRTLQIADSYVLSAAEVPNEKSFPPTMPFMALGAIGALALSCCGALLLERGGETIRSLREVQPMLTVRALGMIPKLPIGHSVATEVVDQAQSPFTESIRKVLSSLRVGAERGRVILVTSAQVGDGKTSLAVALSRLASLSGSRVLLIDCDLRRPTVHHAFQTGATPGLTEVLQGQSPLPSVCRRDSQSDLDFITSGEIGPRAANLLSISAMRTLVSEMKERYDLVFLDSPPSALVSDARILAQIADEVVLVVSWNKSPWRLVRDEIEEIAYGKVNLTGVVLNKVDIQSDWINYGYPIVEPTSADKRIGSV